MDADLTGGDRAQSDQRGPNSQNQLVSPTQSSLGKKVARGAAWSAVNNFTVRLLGLGVSILLARMLAPQFFGIFAVAITTQAVLITLADLGVSVDLLRHGDFAGRAPTTSTVGLVFAVLVAVTMVAVSRPVAVAMGSPEAATQAGHSLRSRPVRRAAVRAVPHLSGKAQRHRRVSLRAK